VEDKGRIGLTITKLIVGGFKSIRERTEIPIAPLTLLFGPNSAGKSAVLAALDALSKKLIEKTGDEVWFVQVLLRAVSVQSNAHQHPPKADQDEPSRSHVTLGLEIDSFPSGENKFRREHRRRAPNSA
jgi:predicted ATPase